jgi:hypothetical protein
MAGVNNPWTHGICSAATPIPFSDGNSGVSLLNRDKYREITYHFLGQELNGSLFHPVSGSKISCESDGMDQGIIRANDGNIP